MWDVKTEIYVAEVSFDKNILKPMAISLRPCEHCESMVNENETHIK